MAVRYTGRLKKWNAERGFGFIVADDGGAELFVHISAFARNAPPPAVGEKLTFEVEPDRNGRRSAVRAMRPGDQPARAPASYRDAPPRYRERQDAGEGSGFLSKLITGAMLCAMAWFGYSMYATRAARFESSLPAPPAVHLPGAVQTPALTAPVPLLSGRLPVPAGFTCDGRSHCSQMTSCREATLFLQNCPGMQMDGNGDGVPCEQQWCN